jgi:hypothetical protein
MATLESYTSSYALIFLIASILLLGLKLSRVGMRPKGYPPGILSILLHPASNQSANIAGEALRHFR